MICGAIEIHDDGLLAVGEDGRMLAPPSPGYAVVDDEVVTGMAAARRSRLRPRLVDHRFWSELDAAPMGRPFPDGLSRADLAHAHLAALWAEVGGGVNEVLLAVPGSASEAQLGLLLGVSRAAGIPVRGLVDAAVAASSGTAAGERLLHLDLQLHRAVLTEMTGGGELQRQAVRALSGAGLHAIRDAWFRRIAGIFVARTRFDPQHAAATEQSLFDALPHVVARLRRHESCPLELRSSGRVHAVDVGRAELLAATAGIYDGIRRLARAGLGSGGARLLLSDRAAALPGLATLLSAESWGPPEQLPPGAAAAGALRCRDAIRADGEALPFITRLPVLPPVEGTDGPA
ncbi:MAG: hypothetical protein PVF68_11770 [Acidobacteriota bacterium]